jgi:phage-related protein
VSLKIVFNGKEYDSVEAMPPDVRKEYEVALETLRKAGDADILSLLQRGGDTRIQTTVREVVVNGKKYDSLDAMPPDVRRTYEQAMAQLAPGGAGVRPPAISAARTMRPPSIDQDGAPGGGMWRIPFWIAVGALGAWWLLRHG